MVRKCVMVLACVYVWSTTLNVLAWEQVGICNIGVMEHAKRFCYHLSPPLLVSRCPFPSAAGDIWPWGLADLEALHFHLHYLQEYLQRETQLELGPTRSWQVARVDGADLSIW